MGLALNQEITNTELFNTIVSESLERAADYPRWQNAINKGVTQFHLNGEFMTWDADTKGLIIWSQSSNKVYASNGVCQCEAYAKKQPCWHRALARITRLYFEALVNFENHVAEVNEHFNREMPRIGESRFLDGFGGRRKEQVWLGSYWGTI